MYEKIKLVDNLTKTVIVSFKFPVPRSTQVQPTPT